MDFKNEFTRKFSKFKSKVFIHSEFCLQISHQKSKQNLLSKDDKLNVVHTKTDAENKKKLIENESLNVIVFNVTETTNIVTENRLIDTM